MQILVHHSKDDSHLEIHATGIQRLEAANDIVRSRINMEEFQVAGKTQTEIIKTTFHHRIRGAQIESLV